MPANQLNDSAKHDGDYVVDLTQEQIENFPPFDEQNLNSDQEWSVYESRYRDSWSEGGILHREGSNRIVTPSSEAAQRRFGIIDRLKCVAARHDQRQRMQYSYDRHEDKSKIQKLAKFLAEVDEDRAKIWRSNARSMVNAFQMATEPGLSPSDIL